MALKPKQIKLIEAILTYPDAPNTELAEIVGINRNTVTVYRRDAEFQAELEKRLKELWKDSEALAVVNMRKLATEGNFQANKYILDSLGYAPTQKVDTTLHSPDTITIVIDE